MNPSNSGANSTTAVRHGFWGVLEVRAVAGRDEQIYIDSDTHGQQPCGSTENGAAEAVDYAYMQRRERFAEQ